MSDRKKVLTLEDFEEFLRDYPCFVESSEKYPLSEDTLTKFFEYVKEGMPYAKKECTSRRNKS